MSRHDASDPHCITYHAHRVTPYFGDGKESPRHLALSTLVKPEYLDILQGKRPISGQDLLDCPRDWLWGDEVLRRVAIVFRDGRVRLYEVQGDDYAVVTVAASLCWHKAWRDVSYLQGGPHELTSDLRLLADLAPRGGGFCYLAGVAPRDQIHVSRLLGSNPSLLEYMRFRELNPTLISDEGIGYTYDGVESVHVSRRSGVGTCPEPSGVIRVGGFPPPCYGVGKPFGAPFDYLHDSCAVCTAYDSVQWMTDSGVLLGSASSSGGWLNGPDELPMCRLRGLQTAVVFSRGVQGSADSGYVPVGSLASLATLVPVGWVKGLSPISVLGQGSGAYAVRGDFTLVVFPIGATVCFTRGVSVRVCEAPLTVGFYGPVGEFSCSLPRLGGEVWAIGCDSVAQRGWYHTYCLSEPWSDVGRSRVAIFGNTGSAEGRVEQMFASTQLSGRGVASCGPGERYLVDVAPGNRLDYGAFTVDGEAIMVSGPAVVQYEGCATVQRLTEDGGLLPHGPAELVSVRGVMSS